MSNWWWYLVSRLIQQRSGNCVSYLASYLGIKFNSKIQSSSAEEQMPKMIYAKLHTHNNPLHTRISSNVIVCVFLFFIFFVSYLQKHFSGWVGGSCLMCVCVHLYGQNCLPQVCADVVFENWPFYFLVNNTWIFHHHTHFARSLTLCFFVWFVEYFFFALSQLSQSNNGYLLHGSMLQIITFLDGKLEKCKRNGPRKYIRCVVVVVVIVDGRERKGEKTIEIFAS